MISMLLIQNRRCAHDSLCSMYGYHQKCCSSNFNDSRTTLGSLMNLALFCSLRFYTEFFDNAFLRIAAKMLYFSASNHFLC
ncbi:unnamed protein product [Moneuplotes crassus]|uniref:Uncharacterized protein n=1 Tax=Euplotes crassus TaxID=5936 RepID=A0AAD1XHI1_EUPCR|nr:unnamed protein product [Moneuplotes crassus]